MNKIYFILLLKYEAYVLIWYKSVKRQIPKHNMTDSIENIIYLQRIDKYLNITALTFKFILSSKIVETVVELLEKALNLF